MITKFCTKCGKRIDGDYKVISVEDPLAYHEYPPVRKYLCGNCVKEVELFIKNGANKK